MATEFKLPEVGEGIDAGTVVSILVAVGDSISKDQPVLELETDKAVVEVPSDVSGVITEINVKENQEAQVGQVILKVDPEGQAQSSQAEPAKSASDIENASQDSSADTATSDDKEDKQDKEDKEDKQDKEKSAPAESKPATSQSTSGGSIPAAPSVRRLARELGVDLQSISGSGILGRISAEDVKHYAETGSVASSPAAPAAAPATPALKLPDFSKFGEVRREPMSGIRKATVKQMTLAWSTVPMVTNFDKADIGEFERLRKKYQPHADAQSAKITPTAMLLKVVAAALHKFPEFNASIDAANNEVIYKEYINVGVAVDTDYGLLVPVIRNADKKGIVELAVELGSLAAKARERKLSPEDMQGGNFSISNLGGIGGTNFTPIVNTPEVAILGVSRGSYEPVYDKEKGEFVPRMMMPLSLSYDHRLIDGANAARFLRYLCTAIEDPFLISVL